MSVVVDASALVALLDLLQVAHRDLADLPVDYWPYAPLAERVWELRHNTTAYDAAYLALAEALEVPLVTCDTRLANVPGARCRVLTPRPLPRRISPDGRNWHRGCRTRNMGSDQWSSPRAHPVMADGSIGFRRFAMSSTSGRGARKRARALLVVVVGLGPWLAPFPTADVARAGESGCGRNWDAAAQIGSLPGELTEVSGFVSSSRYPGVAWMIRDSDNPHSLYSFELENHQPRWKEFPISKVSNADWEDVAYTTGADGRGRLWILENVSQNLPEADKRIYEVLEPDPHSDRSARLVATYRFGYPGGNQNTEALFALGDSLMVVPKTSPATVYRLPFPLARDQVNQAQLVGGLDIGSLVTAASTSADDRLIMTVSTSDVVSVIESRGDPGDIDGFIDSDPVLRRAMPVSQREAGDFFPHRSCDLILVSEDATVWKLSNPRSAVATGGPEAPVDHSGPAPPPSTPVTPYGPPPPVPMTADVPSPGEGPGVRSGYWMLASNGAVHAFGDAGHLGEPSTVLGSAAAVDLEPTPSGEGYWVVDDKGLVRTYGDAAHFGSLRPDRLATGETVTSLSRTPTGGGYWLFTARGRALAFGDARSFGDMGKVALNGLVLDSVATRSGLGYYMVAADGGVFAFGDARFHGSMGGARLSAPVQSLVPDPDGAGYWLVAADGGVFAFEAPFRGSMGGIPLNRPVTGMVAFGNGYVMVGEDGGAFNFSDRPFSGSLGERPPAYPVISVAAAGNL